MGILQWKQYDQLSLEAHDGARGSDRLCGSARACTHSPQESFGSLLGSCRVDYARMEIASSAFTGRGWEICVAGILEIFFDLANNDNILDNQGYVKTRLFFPNPPCIWCLFWYIQGQKFSEILPYLHHLSFHVSTTPTCGI